MTPASAHSSTTSSTAWAGTAITARSTLPGTAATEGYAVRRRRVRTLGLTGWMLPVKPASTSRSSSWLPIELRRRLAPITAMVRGVRMERTLRASARCSRDIATALDESVGSMSKPTSTTPSSMCRFTS